MAQLRNAYLAGVKLSPTERQSILQRYAKYGHGDEEATLRAYAQRQYRIKNNLQLGKGNKGAAARARSAGALGEPNTDSSGNALAPGQRGDIPTPQSSSWSPIPSMTLTAPVKGGTGGGRPLVAPQDKQTSKSPRRQRILANIGKASVR